VQSISCFQNDLLCVEWAVKAYSLNSATVPFLSAVSFCFFAVNLISCKSFLIVLLLLVLGRSGPLSTGDIPYFYLAQFAIVILQLLKWVSKFIQRFCIAIYVASITFQLCAYIFFLAHIECVL